MKIIGILAATLIFTSAATASFAMSKSDGQVGWVVCENWCLDHNKTSASRSQCIANCAIYWKKRAGGITELAPQTPEPPRRPVLDGLAPINPGLGKAPDPGGRQGIGNGIVVLQHPTKLR